MPAPAISPAVRSILLSSDINISTDEVIKKARANGVTAPEKSLRDTIYNIKSELRKKAAKAGVPKPAPSAAHATKTPEPALAKTVTDPVPTTSSSAPDLSAVLANVALVNTVVGDCGGTEQARKVAEAVRACGGVEAFLQHLELVAKVRGGASV
jgi:hypothetical protein